MRAGAAETARKLDHLPELAAAFAAGEISRAHVEQVTDADTSERAEMLSGVERELVDYARIATPPELRAAVRRLTDAFDDDGGARADEAEHARNRLSLSNVAGRGELSGDLDAESTEIVATALDAGLEALAPPDGEPRDRRPIPNDVRRLIRSASNTSPPGPTSRAHPGPHHVNVTPPRRPHRQLTHPADGAPKRRMSAGSREPPSTPHLRLQTRTHPDRRSTGFRVGA